SFHPKAIVLDVLLQGEHTWDFLRDLKQDPATRDIRVFVVTVVDNREKALSLGADGFYSKPVDRVWLLNQLEALVVPAHRPRILVIDDDATSRYLVRNILADLDCELLEATGGAEGLRVARESKPLLIILDLSMNGMNGFDVLERLREDAETNSLPVVVHTSMSLDESDYDRLRSAIDIIPKSIMSSRELAVARFSQALQKAGAKDLARANETVSSS